VALAGLLLVLVATAAARDAAAFSPGVNYALHCQGCHLADGRATPGLVPAIDGEIGRFMRVPEGREYLIRLPNVAATQLDDADTAALLNWLVHRFAARELPADFRPYTADEIAAGRRRPLVDVEGARRGVLRALGEPPG
jgi:mono/diheme cytochrome c family protein